jgi:hypothetical protein
MLGSAESGLNFSLPSRDSILRIGSNPQAAFFLIQMSTAHIGRRLYLRCATTKSSTQVLVLSMPVAIAVQHASDASLLALSADFALGRIALRHPFTLFPN